MARTLASDAAFKKSNPQAYAALEEYRNESKPKLKDFQCAKGTTEEGNCRKRKKPSSCRYGKNAKGNCKKAKKEQTVYEGKRGGAYVLTKSGKKRYLKF